MSNLNRIKIYTYIEGEPYLQDRNSSIIKRNEWEEIKLIVNNFYQEYSDVQIDTSNNIYQEERLLEQENTMNRKVERTPKAGSVYFLKSDRYGVKIGNTKNLTARIKSFTTTFPFPVELLAFITVNDCEALESQLHIYFKDKNIKGEWFDINENEIKLWERNYKRKVVWNPRIHL